MTRLQARDAAKVVGVQPRTIHKWAREGWIVRYSDGYDMAELLAAERNRNHAALMIRAGLSKAEWPRDIGPEGLESEHANGPEPPRRRAG